MKNEEKCIQTKKMDKNEEKSLGKTLKYKVTKKNKQKLHSKWKNN